MKKTLSESTVMQLIEYARLVSNKDADIDSVLADAKKMIDFVKENSEDLSLMQQDQK